jgi:hypothetical protein
VRLTGLRDKKRPSIYRSARVNCRRYGEGLVKTDAAGDVCTDCASELSRKRRTLRVLLFGKATAMRSINSRLATLPVATLANPVTRSRLNTQ